MRNQSISRDERTIKVENASYRWGYLVITYGLLVIIALRAFIFNQSNWDLFALVFFISGLVTTAYQGVHHISYLSLPKIMEKFNLYRETLQKSLRICFPL